MAHWAIFWPLLAPLTVRFVSLPIRSPIRILLPANDVCSFSLGSPIIPAEYPNNIFPRRHLETCRPEISKLDLGTIENGSAASDLPPEGPKKKSWADLTHLAHFAKSKPRDYRKWIRSVRFTPRGSEKRALRRFETTKPKV